MWARGYFCATVGAVDEATIKAYIENQRWDEDDESFKITAPHQALSRLSAGTAFRRLQTQRDFQSPKDSTGFQPVDINDYETSPNRPFYCEI
jgi:hypothetical protein